MSREKTRKRKTGDAYLLHLPPELRAAAQHIAEARDQTLADYIRRAVRTQVLIDGTGMESDTVLRLVEEGTERISRGTNFAAVASQATLLLVKQLLLERRLAAGLPRDIAEGQVDALADAAVTEAEAIYSDPRTRAAYAWVEREDPEAFAERLLEGVAEDEDLED
ncbi:MAG: hypothetical protein K6U87_04125 [Firmicutes bacterium]|nr:hypothetical protein [Bacillota bacterium]